MNPLRTTRSRRLVLLGLLASVAAVTGLLAPAADHRDGPIFVNTAVNGFADINDVYIFQAPGNINNTVLILDVQPFPGNLSPATFDPRVIFDLKVDNNGDAVEDITFRVTFGPPDTAGVQDVTLRALPSTKFPPTGILARGKTGQNLPVQGGGMFRAAVHDDPFFFDAGAFNAFIAAGQGSPVRPAGQAKNFFGPNVNTLSMILEIPTARLRSSPSNPNVGVFATATLNGVQVDRMGRPAINTALIPPIPRNNLARGERRNAFNAGHPRNDRRDFRADMISVFKTAFGRSDADAAGLTDFLLPDLLTFNTSTAFSTNAADSNGFPNGRRLRDDVIDIELNLITNGAIPSDNVPDDNGDKITDGTMRSDGSFRTIAFPYIGAPNLPLNGNQPGNTGPNG
jgi:Domain of unknown function (DUF4331)